MIILDGLKGLNVILLFFRRTLSVPTGPLHQDLLLPGDDHVESRFRLRPCFKTEEGSTIATLPPPRHAGRGRRPVIFQPQLNSAAEESEETRETPELLVGECQSVTRQEPKRGGRKRERHLARKQKEDQNKKETQTFTFQFQHISLKQETRGLDQTCRSDKSPEFHSLPNDRFIQNS